MDMPISKLIEELERIRSTEGDIQTRVQSLSHMWAPEPTVKKGNGAKYVLLNP